MLERAKEVARDGGWARVEYARSADDLVTLVDGYRRHAWLRVAEVAIASPSPAGAWILRNAACCACGSPASDNGRLRHGAAVPARGERRRRVFMLAILEGGRLMVSSSRSSA